MRIFYFFFFIGSLLLNGAIASAAPEFIDSPSQCFSKKTYPCSVRVTGSYLSFERESQKYHLGDRSSVLFVSASEIQLLQGVLWIKDSKELLLKVSPVLHMQLSGEHFLEKSGLELYVRNLNGEVQFQSSRVFPSESLPMGFQNWYGQIDSTGQVSRGMIRPIVMADFLKVWIPVSGSSLAELKKKTIQYRVSWKDALELSAQIYQQVVERRIASHENRIQALERKKQQRLDEQARIRQMFRQKNGLDHL